MANKVQLTLVSGGNFDFTMYHSLVCEPSRDCTCKISQVLVTRTIDGKTGKTYVKQVSGKSVSLNQGVAVELPRAVLYLQQVADAVKKGVIQVKVIESENIENP